jgi:SAM-dependent methyltransferase
LGISSWVLRHCFRLYERSKSFDGGSSERAKDGLPLPPPMLRVQVAGTSDIAAFLEGGQLAVGTVRELLAECGSPIEASHVVLDFGCGCGRVLRHWKDLSEATLYGTDMNRELVQWCDEHLPFATVTVNSVEPPTSFGDEFFDAVYAFSIFTHMPAEAQKGWLEEFRRILKPGGLLVFSTHGSYYKPRLRDGERRRFDEGSLVVRFESAAGSNLCNAYHPEAFVGSELARGWEIAAFRPEGARGNPRQDAWVFRRPRAQ